MMQPDQDRLFQAEIYRDDDQKTQEETSTTTVPFTEAFEGTVLPALNSLMQQIAPDEHAILVLGTKDDRVLEIMTGKKLSGHKQQQVRDLVTEKLPRNVMENTSVEFQFKVGEVERLAWRRS
jgi:hypothetical protein